MAMDHVFDAFLTAIGSGILTIIILVIKMMVKKLNNDDLTMKALAHDAYFRHARYLLAKDEISEEELENHNYLYRAYHSQGLNGTGDRLHELVLEKKVIVHSHDGIIHKLPY